MAVCGEGGVLMLVVGLLGSGCGNILGRDGGNSIGLVDFMWVMSQRLAFGMMCGVGIKA